METKGRTRHSDLGEGSLRPQRVETERAEWLAEAAQGDPVLDLTCGQGTSAIALARAGVRVVGFDRDPAALEQVRARLSEETPETRERLSFVTAGERPLPLTDRGFDTVLLADVPEHAADLGELLDEARRLVRPSGRIVLSSLLEASPRALSRSSLSRLARQLGPRLRPAQIVDGERWVGVVAVPAAAPGRRLEPWTALLEIADARLSRVGDAYADQAVRLAETRTREGELSVRVEDLAANLARSERDVDDLRARVEDLESRLADAITAVGAAREDVAETERRMSAEAAARERKLSEVREAGRALAKESDRRKQRILALEAQLEEAAAATPRERDEPIGEEARLRADLRVQTARAARAQAHAERRDAKLADLRAGRAHRLAARWWRIRKRLRHPLGGP